MPESDGRVRRAIEQHHHDEADHQAGDERNDDLLVEGHGFSLRVLSEGLMKN